MISFGSNDVGQGVFGDFSMISATEARRNFGVLQERALGQPVVIANLGRPQLVLSSAETFFGRRNEEELHRASALQSALSEAPDQMSEGLLVLDHGFRIAAVNRAFVQMMHRNEEELLGQVWQDAFPAASDQPITIWLRYVMRTGSPVQFEANTRQTPRRYYFVSIYPHAEGVAALIYDQTQEKLATIERDAHRSLSEMLALMENAGYLRIDSCGLVDSASDQVRELLGYDPSQPLQPLGDLAAPKHRKLLLDVLDEVLSGGEGRTFSISLQTACNAELPAEMALAPLRRGRKIVGATGLFCAHPPRRGSTASHAPREGRPPLPRPEANADASVGRPVPR